MKFKNAIAKSKVTLVVALACAVVRPASAIEIDGSGDLTGIAALYLFKNYNPATGIVPDVSGVGAPLDLQVDDPANVVVTNESDPNYGNVSGLKLKIAAALRSVARADKILACGKAGGGITADLYIRNLAEEPVGWTQPTRILTLSRLVTNASGAPVRHDGRFFVGQEYISSGVYSVSISGNPDHLSTPDNKGLLMFGTNQAIQRIVFTVNNRNVARLWASNSAAMPQRYVEEAGVPMPTTWNTEPAASDFRLSVGNEPFYNLFPRTAPDPQDPRKTINHPERKSWLGTVYALAIYCRGIEPLELLGSRAGNTPQAVIPLPDDVSTFQITPTLQKAHLIYKRITGVNTPITNPLVSQMAAQLSTSGVAAAARLATFEKSFYNITVRDMAARMSTRDLSVNTELNDMIATIIGVTRDDRPATELLTGNYRYQGRTDLTIAPTNEKMDFLMSNNHYKVLEEQRYDLAAVLTIVNGQKLYNGSSDSVVLNPEPAGVVTSRAFMSAHAVAGTNRRLVEYTFKEFMCVDLGNWADMTATDAFVGRDVERAPGNDSNKFMTSCRSCHSVMDGFRGAFAKWDFSANYVKHADIVTPTTVEDDNELVNVMFQIPSGVAGKYARNPQTFAAGYATTGTYWQNNANIGANKLYFGWPAVPAGQATQKGYGVKAFAELLSQSKAFPRCMAMRAFRSLCKRTAGDGYASVDDKTAEINAVYAVGDQFAASGYKIRDLFAGVAGIPQCLGN